MPIHWFFAAVITAVLYGLQSAYLKGVLPAANQLLIAWAIFTFALPVYVAMVVYVGLPAVSTDFYWSLGVSLTINLISWPLFVRAVQISEISLVMPLVAFTPVFVLGVEYVVLGAVPHGWGLGGILLIVAGAYVLNVRRDTAGAFEPLTSLSSEPGARLMLIVAVLWSISATVEKVAVGSSSPGFYLASLGLGFSVVFSCVVAIRVEQPVDKIRTRGWALVGAGVLTGLMTGFQMYAIKDTPLVNYVISIKRAGMIVSVVAGWLVFKEKNILFRMIGASLMVVGVVVIRMA